MIYRSKMKDFKLVNHDSVEELQPPVIMKSSISKKLWALKDSDPEAFKREVRAYFARGYPGWTVIRAKYPFIYLRDDRRKE